MGRRRGHTSDTLVDSPHCGVREAIGWVDRARFDAALPEAAGVEPRKMFGMPCAFVNGNMFAGLFEESVMVRLDDAGRSEVEEAGGSQFAPMGTAMKEYVALSGPQAADDEDLAGWIDRAFGFASTLPPKQPKPRKKKV
jgi:TfoX/Sxy family transcriptional regulator of competence genes